MTAAPMPIKARYVQHWLKTEREIPNHSAARIFAAATSILKAGSPAPGSH